MNEWVLTIVKNCDQREGRGQWVDEYYAVNTKQKKTSIATLISNEVNFRKKALLEIKECFLIIQEWVVSKLVNT